MPIRKPIILYGDKSLNIKEPKSVTAFLQDSWFDKTSVNFYLSLYNKTFACDNNKNNNNNNDNNS